ncbi:MAG: hypothetical protein R2733_26640 [Acidimicrobiales bacterium]
MIELEEEPGGRRWRFDADFLRSRWECRWGCDCVGILDEPANELGQGCCSVGAELLDRDEAMQVGAAALSLDPARFQFHAGDSAGMADYFDPDNRRTLVVDGACVFLNRPGFAGGEGCALHLAALDDGESPIDVKPSVCWQLPLKVTQIDDDGVPVTLLRRWQREDWGPGGATMAWLCTDPEATPSAYVGERMVIDSLADELAALLGTPLFESLRRALQPEGQ